MSVMNNILEVISALAVFQSTTVAVLGLVSLLYIYRKLVGSGYKMQKGEVRKRMSLDNWLHQTCRWVRYLLIYYTVLAPTYPFLHPISWPRCGVWQKPYWILDWSQEESKLLCRKTWYKNMWPSAVIMILLALSPGSHVNIASYLQISSSVIAMESVISFWRLEITSPTSTELTPDCTKQDFTFSCVQPNT